MAEVGAATCTPRAPVGARAHRLSRRGNPIPSVLDPIPRLYAGSLCWCLLHYYAPGQRKSVPNKVTNTLCLSAYLYAPGHGSVPSAGRVCWPAVSAHDRPFLRSLPAPVGLPAWLVLSAWTAASEWDGCCLADLGPPSDDYCPAIRVQHRWCGRTALLIIMLNC